MLNYCQRCHGHSIDLTRKEVCDSCEKDIVQQQTYLQTLHRAKELRRKNG